MNKFEAECLFSIYLFIYDVDCQGLLPYYCKGYTLH